PRSRRRSGVFFVQSRPEARHGGQQGRLLQEPRRRRNQGPLLVLALVQDLAARGAAVLLALAVLAAHLTLLVAAAVGEAAVVLLVVARLGANLPRLALVVILEERLGVQDHLLALAQARLDLHHAVVAHADDDVPLRRNPFGADHEHLAVGAAADR